MHCLDRDVLFCGIENNHLGQYVLFNQYLFDCEEVLQRYAKLECFTHLLYAGYNRNFAKEEVYANS